MGALSVAAMLAGRRSSRLYLLLLAAIITLAVDPRLAADVGWQLSFAAVLGIILLAPSLRAAIVARSGGGGIAAALADASAMTIAASLATAPLIAFHFEAVSTTTLLANLLALPAIGPAMWLGMLAAAAGQVPGFPVELLNAVNAPLLAFVAQVAAWCGRPAWAYPQVSIDGLGLVASYLALAIAALAVRYLLRRRRLGRLRRPAGPRPRRRLGPAPVAAALFAALCLAWGLPTRGSAGAAAPPDQGLRVSVLDVGQGDAILLQQPRAPAVLVDGGPPGGGLLAELRAAGVDRLGAVLVTHDQADHAGGVSELFGAIPIGQIIYGILGRRTLAGARAVGTRTRRIGAGSVLRSGRLRLEVLWPPPELLSGPPGGAEDANRLSVVALARWREFSMLLSGDAEAEATPLDPGPIDVLKVAHHGSEDAGLSTLLDRANPALAVISAGEGNPFGHPAPATLATLASRGIPALRTDRDGRIVLEVRRGHFGVEVRG
jgi:competence protein ComEC